MLLVRKRALGDVLWIEPVIRALAARYKHVVVYTRYNELFANYPLPNVSFTSSLHFIQKLLIRLDRWLHTRVFSIDLDGSYERSPREHFLQAYEETAGISFHPEYPRLYLSETEQNMDTGVTGPFVILHLESLTTQNYRHVYGVDWKAVVETLKQNGYTVLQLGKNPAPIEGAVHRSTALREMIALIAKASLFIGLDSGPSHIATSLGVPSLLFFGAVNPEYRHFPGLMNGRIMQGPCPYAGCFHDAPNPEKLICQVVGTDGIPPCSTHTTTQVIDNLRDLAKITRD